MTEINLRWSPRFVPDEQRLYRSTSPIDIESLPTALATLTADAVDYEDSDVTTGVTYYYVLASVVGDPERVAFTRQITVTASGVAVGGGGDPGDPGGDVGDAVFLQYFVPSDYSASGNNKPPFTALGSDDGALFDTSGIRYVVGAAENGKFAHMVHSFLSPTEGGRDWIVAIEKALAASPTTFVRIAEMRHTNAMGFTVSQPFLLATGDAYQFRYINSGAAITIIASDVRNAMSIEFLEEVT